jgi:hypothetical protein
MDGPFIEEEEPASSRGYYQEGEEDEDGTPPYIP